MCARAINAGKSSEVGVVAFGADLTANHLNPDGDGDGYLNVVEPVLIDKVRVEFIRAIEALEASTEVEGDMISGEHPGPPSSRSNLLPLVQRTIIHPNPIE
jgi:hypothetical protein